MRIKFSRYAFVLILFYIFKLTIYLISAIHSELILYISKKMEISLEGQMLEAVSSNDFDAVTLLLSKGANPNKTTSNGKTCLGEAVYLGFTSIAEKLIAETKQMNKNKPLGNNEQTDIASTPDSTLKTFKKPCLDPNTKCKAPIEGESEDQNQGYYVITHQEVSSDECKVPNISAMTPTSPQTELEWDEEIGTVAATTSEDESVTSMYKWYAAILESTGAAIAAASEYTCGLDQQDAFGKVALNYAADGNHVDIVRALTNAGCKVDFVGSNGWTPLHTSVASNRIEVARALVEAGSNVNLRTPIKTTALHIAACHNVELATLIADHGASLDLRDEKDRTALYIAAAQGHTAIVKFLIDRGANINIGDADGHTPMCQAVMFQHYDTVKVLLESGARITHYQCLLPTAVRQEVTRMVVLLADYGCGINVHNSAGETPLLLAMTLDDPYPIAKALLEKGANVNACNSHTGASALHLAVEYCDERSQFERLLLLFLSRGVDLDRRASTRDTALNRAILLHKDRIAMQLVRYGANVNLCEVLTNVFGNLIIASNRKGLKLANMLIKAGHNKVKLNLVNNPSKTAKWITEIFKSPLSLADICRIRLRNMRGEINLKDFVESLPIPEMIKNFLMMDELNV